jgi:hypothetical protein
MRIKRLAMLASAALVALAMMANAASATWVDAAGDPYDGAVQGTATVSTLSNDLVSVTCEGTITGTITSHGAGILAAPAGMTFQNCTPTATITMIGLPYTFSWGPTPVTFTTAFGMHIDALAFTCTASETAGHVQGGPSWNFSETLNMTGLGCGTTATWSAMYSVKPDLEWIE